MRIVPLDDHLLLADAPEGWGGTGRFGIIAPHSVGYIQKESKASIYTGAGGEAQL